MRAALLWASVLAVLTLTAHPVVHAGEDASRTACALGQALVGASAPDIVPAAVLVAAPPTVLCIVQPQSDAPRARSAFDDARVPRGPPAPSA